MNRLELLKYMVSRFRKAMDFCDELHEVGDDYGLIHDVLNTADNCNEAIEVLYSI